MKKYLIFSVIVLLAACSGGGTETGDAKPGANEMAARIKAMEDSMSMHLAADMRSAQTLLDVYKAYVAAYPLDDRSPEFLFRAARVALVMRDPDQSLRLYDRILVDYPSWDQNVNVYFMKAFVYDDHLKHKGNAQEAYKQVINLFPEHQLANQARMAIDNLQYTDEELIERFQRMQAEDASAEAGR
jgi:tetratricopeptide (TPR) repeat protein